MNPHDIGNGTRGMAKVILLLTLYVVHNETAIVVHIPEAGFNDAKYITNAGGGVNMPAIDSRIPAAKAAQLQAQMAAAQQAMAQAQQQSGININAVTSNAKVFYKKKENLTAIEFTKLGMQMDSATVNLNPEASAVFSILFEGKATKGTHPVNLSPSGIAFSTLTGRACTCGRDDKDDPNGKVLPCAGLLTISNVTDKEISGFIQTRVYYTASNDHIIGWITGKFSALIVNQE
jgi:hypothetical protein